MGDEGGRRAAVGPRLMGMMFLQYFGIGAWIVPLARYLRTAPPAGLGFDDADVGLVYSSWPIGGMIAPLLVAPLADRFFAAEKLLGALHLYMAGMLAAAGLWCRQAGADAAAGPLFWVMLGYAFGLLPSLTLTNVIALRNVPDRAGFPRVRLVGTLGWIVAGYAITWAIDPVSPQPFFLAAGTSLLLAAFSFALPHTPPAGVGRSAKDVFGVAALGLFRDRAFVAFAAAAVLGNMMNQFYVLYANRLLADRGVARPEAVLTLGQWCEIGCMLAAGAAVRRAGLRWVLFAGLAGWVTRNWVLAYAGDELLVAVALPLHGFSYVFFSIVGAMFVDREAPPHLRASAQALVTFLSSGPAVLAGNWVAGRVGRHWTGPDGAVHWPMVWLVPAAGCGLAAAVFLLLFREPPDPPAGRGG